MSTKGKMEGFVPTLHVDKKVLVWAGLTHSVAHISIASICVKSWFALM